MSSFPLRPIGTSINIDSDIPRASNTNGSQARKFVAPSLSTEQEDTSFVFRSNFDHAIEQAAGMRGGATAIALIAEQARANISSFREQLSSETSNLRNDVASVIPNMTDDERENLLSKQASGLTSLLLSELPTLNVSGLATDLVKSTPGAVFQRRVDIGTPQAFNPASPSLDVVSVDMDKNRGTVDCFYSTLKFAIPSSYISDGKLKAVRIFRATVTNPQFQRGVAPVISMHGMERMSTLKMRSRSKTHDQIAPLGNRYRESGVLTSLSLLTPIDPMTNLRLSMNSDTIGANMGTLQTSTQMSSILPRVDDVKSTLDPARFSNLDASVASDPNVIRNIQQQDPSAGNMKVQQTFDVRASVASAGGSSAQLGMAGGVNLATSQIVIDSNNSHDFREIAFLSFDKLRSTIIGDMTIYEIVDETISFGKGYKYYVTTVDSNMIESVRSRIVDIVVEGLRVPDRPSSVYAYSHSDMLSMNIIVEDQLVEKFEIYRRENSPKVLTSVTARNVSDVVGMNVSTRTTFAGANRFIKIGECLNGTNVGSMFVDRSVVPGSSYLYRVYSVDVFGNKSESPFEVNAFMPEKKSKTNDLLKPSLTAETDSKTGKMKLRFSCQDPRVMRLIVARKDLTLHQKDFVAPSGVSSVIFGLPRTGDSFRRMEGEVLRGENVDTSWSGVFENTGTEITFVDATVHVDHVYQYKIHGIDRFGNMTSCDFSKKVMVLNRPMTSPPVNVTTEIMQGPNFSVAGVNIEWRDGSADKSSEDLVGSQEKLADTAVRTLFQLERKKIGEERWYEFPMTAETSITDLTSVGLAPRNAINGTSIVSTRIQRESFMPPVLESDQSYVYRVRAMQSGSFISNYSDEVSVFVSLPIVAPENFRVRASNANVRPFYVALNWDTPNNSAVVDRWQIERAEMNNFAASRLNLKNTYDFQSLRFEKFRTVYRESSRFMSQGLDSVLRTGTELVNITKSNVTGVRTSVFSGDHRFQDTDVRFGNTYFYRIRAVGTNGEASEWVYRGVKVTETSVERSIEALVSEDMMKKLSTMQVAMNLMTVTGNNEKNSFSLQPSFSDPSALPSVVITKPDANPPPQPTTTENSVDENSRAKLFEGGAAAVSLIFRGV